jgi:hypothetical protein
LKNGSKTLDSETTLQMSGEDSKLHSKRVEKMKNTLEKSGEDEKQHSKRVEKKLK